MVNEDRDVDMERAAEAGLGWAEPQARKPSCSTGE